MNEAAQGMWNIFLMEFTKHWTKMQELSFIFIKPNLAFCSVWLLVCLSPSWSKEGCMRVRVFTLLLFHSLQKVSGQQIFEKCLKIFFICCSHPSLIKIRFKGSNCMDPRFLAIILFHFFKRDISSFCLTEGIYFFLLLFTKFISLNKAGLELAQMWMCILKYTHRVPLGKVICDSLACCAIFADVPPVPSFISMNLRTYPSILKISCRG